ncbi:MAG: UDP-glucose/GDP-mannose dehydrogenase family protein [Bacteroidales bacterium]|nr:UDP-glucose/GDP-mannose dehydrogenase family protein [Bacteroidales bacterium]
MKVLIVGTGYVGLVTGACFSEMGVDVRCVDVDKNKIEGLKNGIMPIYERGLEDIVIKNYKAGRLGFSTDLESSINLSDVIFNAVGTPPDEDGSADLRYVLDVARTVGRNMNKYMLVVTKSTVPVGTADKVKKTIEEELDKRGLNIDFDVVSNPEFLKEGDAIDDFMKPDRIVIGISSEKAKKIMERLYKPFMVNNYRIIFTDVHSAEMIKYAANAMLATRISFMNDIANLCEIVGANVNMVRKGIGTDSRIGPKFLYPGCGYGGSCFPKDVKALIKTAQHNGYEMKVLESVESVNEKQKSVLYSKVFDYFKGELKGLVIAIWGLAFKPETDDMREAPALIIIDLLLKAGCKIKVYDPVAIPEAKRRLRDSITYCNDKYEAVIDADALLLITEWKEFRILNYSVLKNTMNKRVIIDGRNIYDVDEVRDNGFTYFGIGIN